jgi:hypothetical protein
LPPLEQIWHTFAFVVLPPALVAAALAVPLCWLARRDDAFAYAGSALGLAGGMAFGSWFCDEALPLTRMPGPAAWEWLPWVMLAALATGVVASLHAVPAGVGWSLRGAVSAHAGWLLVPAELRFEYLWAPLLLGAVVLAEWAVLEQLDWGGLVPMAAAPSAVAASVVLLLAGSLRFNQVALILAGSLTGIGVVALALRATAGATGPAVAVILPALVLAGWYETFSEVPKTSFVLAALAPLALSPSLLPAWRRYQRKGLWAVQVILLLLPLAGAVLLAAQHESLDYE